MKERIVFLDTETTGLSYAAGDRVIELGCVEMINRRLTGHNLQLYFKVDRESSPDALKVHGITTEFLSDKPTFKEMSDTIIQYLSGAKIVIHNAPFDTGFLNYEFGLLGQGVSLEQIVDEIEDSLILAREKRPGKRNNLDALCEDFGISNKHRVFHGALLDAQLLAEVWLALTKEQFGLHLSNVPKEDQGVDSYGVDRVDDLSFSYAKVQLTQEDLQAHQVYLETLKKENKAPSLWEQSFQSDKQEGSF